MCVCVCVCVWAGYHGEKMLCCKGTRQLPANVVLLIKTKTCIHTHSMMHTKVDYSYTIIHSMQHNVLGSARTPVADSAKLCACAYVKRDRAVIIQRAI